MPKLQTFKADGAKNNIRNMIIAAGIILLFLISFAIYKTYAYYKQVEEHDVIKAKIGNFAKAEYTSYDNTNTGLNCTGENATAQCAIDEISKMLGE